MLVIQHQLEEFQPLLNLEMIKIVLVANMQI